MIREATAELAQIPVGDDGLPAVMSARIDLSMAKKEWVLVAGRGEILARSHPKIEAGWIAWAYALRELNRIPEAKAVLLEAEPILGRKCGVLHYNLACYYCLLGEPQEAKRRLAIACRMDGQWKQSALADPDLQAMRDEITALG